MVCLRKVSNIQLFVECDMRNYREFWRRLLGGFLVGDRVKIPDWTRKGTITRKRWNPVYSIWVYDVDFDHKMRLDFFPSGKRLCDGFIGMPETEIRLVRKYERK